MLPRHFHLVCDAGEVYHALGAGACAAAAQFGKGKKQSAASERKGGKDLSAELKRGWLARHASKDTLATCRSMQYYQDCNSWSAPSSHHAAEGGA